MRSILFRWPFRLLLMPRAGKGQLAQELRDLVDGIKQKQQSRKIGGSLPIARPKGELAGLLSVTYPKTRLSEMVLGPATGGRCPTGRDAA